MTDRELDAAIAEKVMGWTRRDKGGGAWEWVDPMGLSEFRTWSPSGYIGDAWRVVEWLGNRAGFTVTIERSPAAVWTVYLDGGWAGSRTSDTAPRAICEAALAALAK